MPKRHLLYFSGLLVFLAFVVLLQQLITTRKYFFQAGQILHHETAAIFLIALALGIVIGATKSD